MEAQDPEKSENMKQKIENERKYTKNKKNGKEVKDKKKQKEKKLFTLRLIFHILNSLPD